MGGRRSRPLDQTEQILLLRVCSSVSKGKSEFTHYNRGRAFRRFHFHQFLALQERHSVRNDEARILETFSLLVVA